MNLVIDAVSYGVLILAIVATVVVARRLRGFRLASWIAVIWFLPFVGSVIALTCSGDRK